MVIPVCGLSTERSGAPPGRLPVRDAAGPLTADRWWSWMPGGRVPAWLSSGPTPCAALGRSAHVSDGPSAAWQLVHYHPGLRIRRTDAVFETAMLVTLEQRVATHDAWRSWRGLVGAFGEPAPGPLRDSCPTPPRTHVRQPYEVSIGSESTPTCRHPAPPGACRATPEDRQPAPRGRLPTFPRRARRRPVDRRAYRDDRFGGSRCGTDGSLHTRTWSPRRWPAKNAALTSACWNSWSRFGRIARTSSGCSWRAPNPNPEDYWRLEPARPPPGS